MLSSYNYKSTIKYQTCRLQDKDRQKSNEKKTIVGGDTFLKRVLYGFW